MRCAEAQSVSDSITDDLKWGLDEEESKKHSAFYLCCTIEATCS